MCVCAGAAIISANVFRNGMIAPEKKARTQTHTNAHYRSIDRQIEMAHEKWWWWLCKRIALFASD